MRASLRSLPLRSRSLWQLRSPTTILALGILLAALGGAAPALGAEASPVPEAPSVAHWSLESRAAPTNLQREGEGPLDGEGFIVASASNLGDASAHGSVEIVDRLPRGIVATSASPGTNSSNSSGKTNGFTCSKSTGPEVVCTRSLLPVVPYEQLLVEIHVRVEASAEAESFNEVTVSGGGAVPASTSLRRALKVNGSQTTFGLEKYAFEPETASFEPDAQAGSHPFQLTTTFNLNEVLGTSLQGGRTPVSVPKAPALPKNLSFQLPAGLVGNINVVSQCSDLDFGVYGEGGVNACPNKTAVGVATVTFNAPNDGSGFVTWAVPVFNLVPAPGEPAKFGFSITHVPVVLDTSVRTGEDYGVTVSVHNASEAVQVLGSRVTFWGTPGDPRHNASRGWTCLGFGASGGPQEPCDPGFKLEGPPPPFLTLPTACGPLNTSVEGEAWNAAYLAAEGKSFTIPTTKGESPVESTLTGCEGLPFDPSIEVAPDQHEASTPTGMTVKVNVPQGPTLESNLENGRAEQDVRSTRLELPIGLQASPAAATGLGTCAVEAAGFNGANTDTGTALESELTTQGFTPAAASCPESAKIGTVNIKTPLLEKEVIGDVYLASQDTNPFGSPLVLYIIAEEEKSKVLVKLAGEVKMNSENGQLVSEFRNTPQTPFESLTLHLTNGPRATESTPPFCGEYHATAAFTTWSGAGATARESSPFQITSGPNGSPCPGATLPFGPGFNAGSTNKSAGAYSPFTLTIEKPDGQQALESISAQLAPGMAAKIASVTPCAAAAVASLPTLSQSPPACGPESEIGTTTASSGLGGDPVTLGGKLYLTEAVDGAPFGLLAVTHAQTGPFDLGWVNILSTISINPATAVVTTKTVKPVPRILDGVPVQLKQIHVSVDRPEFDFNPTNCEAAAVSGTLTGWEGASDLVSYPSVTENCAALAFAPKLTASVLGHGSKAGGTTFKVKVESAGIGPHGVGEANIHKVDLTLPVLLPSRLTTIQKACLAATFEANPGNCGEGSMIGEGIVHTPVFKNPLKGAAYLVSHGNAAFPDVEFVLKGEKQEEKVTIVLDGKTDIKKGITYSKFETAPDAPFTTFETVLPAGPHSALTANVPEKENFSLCKTKPTMNTVIVAQSGRRIEQNTKIALIGCGGVLPAKAKKLSRAQLLAKALKTCRKKDKGKKSKRIACEKQAHKKYGPKHRKKTTKKK